MIDLPPIIERVKKIVLIVGYSLLAVIIVGYLYQTISTEQDRSKVEMPGKLIKANDYSLHLKCTGSGSPTIILEAAAGELSSSWGWIQPELTKETRVCSYDRQGRGWSTGQNVEGNLEAVAKDLHTALTGAQLNDKYILVGHSLGGIYIRKYQELYPDEVIGLVLVDSSHPYQITNYPEYGIQAKNTANNFTLYSYLARIGIMRAFISLGGSVAFSSLPERELNEYKYFWVSPEYFSSVANENNQSETILKQSQELSSLGGIPLRVISSDQANEDWNVLQGDLLNLSSESTRITVPESTHMSLLFNKDHAHRTSEVILALLESIRNEE